MAIKETPNDATLAQDESENEGENFENSKHFIQDRTKDIGKKVLSVVFIEMETANMGCKGRTYQILSPTDESKIYTIWYK